MPEDENQKPNIETSGNSMAVGGNVGVNDVKDGNVIVGNNNITNITYQTGVPEPIKPRDPAENLFVPKTISISAGPFLMGSQPGVGIPEYETPQHEVTLPAFYIGEFPVKNSEYEEYVRQTKKLVPGIMGWDGQLYRDGEGESPVWGITWNEAMQYCDWLSRVTGSKYTLPNEAQWEKACRGSYGCNESMGQVVEWTCSLWGEKRTAPDAKYSYPWRNDGRNNVKAHSQIRRVVRGYTSPDETGTRRFSARHGRNVLDPGEGTSRHSFRVVLVA